MLRLLEPPTHLASCMSFVHDLGLDGLPIFAKYCPSHEGNLLEAINISLNALSKHFIDRNFERTGQMIIIVTAGPGVYKVAKFF